VFDDNEVLLLAAYGHPMSWPIKQLSYDVKEGVHYFNIRVMCFQLVFSSHKITLNTLFTFTF